MKQEEEEKEEEKEEEEDVKMGIFAIRQRIVKIIDLALTMFG